MMDQDPTACKAKAHANGNAPVDGRLTLFATGHWFMRPQRRDDATHEAKAVGDNVVTLLFAGSFPPHDVNNLATDRAELSL